MADLQRYLSTSTMEAPAAAFCTAAQPSFAPGLVVCASPEAAISPLGLGESGDPLGGGREQHPMAVVRGRDAQPGG